MATLNMLPWVAQVSMEQDVIQLKQQEVHHAEQWFGKMPDVNYNTSVFFKNTYNPRWIIDPLAVEMIADVDRSRVVSEQLIENLAFQRLYQRSEDRL